MTFRCTGKVQRRLRLTPALLAPEPMAADATEWHCNLLVLGRRPSYLVTHSLSLFTVLFPAAGAASPPALAAAIRQHVTAALQRAGYAADEGRRILDPGPDQFCKATDRSVLGSMNDFAGMADWIVYDHRSADPALLAHAADQQMNCAPMSLLGMESPRAVLEGLLRPRGSA